MNCFGFAVFVHGFDIKYHPIFRPSAVWFIDVDVAQLTGIDICPLGGNKIMECHI